MPTSWTVSDMPQLQGKRFFITGANSGIGYYAALELARHGATVVLACRDRARGEAARARLRREATGPESAAGKAELVLLDLASLDSVHQAAGQELKRDLPLHGLINNAGVYAPKQRTLTRDGFELQFGTNVLAHFALTCRLLPALERARAARLEDAPRVVTVASIAHKRGRLNFDDLQAERRYSPNSSYAQSKLADLLFAFELERRLRAAHYGTLSVAVHPGVANTNLFKGSDTSAFERAMRRGAGRLIGAVLNTEAQGALPTLYAATAEGVRGGGYYGPQGLAEMRGGDVGPAKVAPQARDEAAAGHLWQVCEALTGGRAPGLLPGQT